MDITRHLNLSCPSSQVARSIFSQHLEAIIISWSPWEWTLNNRLSQSEIEEGLEGRTTRQPAHASCRQKLCADVFGNLHDDQPGDRSLDLVTGGGALET